MLFVAKMKPLSFNINILNMYTDHRTQKVSSQKAEPEDSHASARTPMEPTSALPAGWAPPARAARRPAGPGPRDPWLDWFGVHRDSELGV